MSYPEVSGSHLSPPFLWLLDSFLTFFLNVPWPFRGWYRCPIYGWTFNSHSFSALRTGIALSGSLFFLGVVAYQHSDSPLTYCFLLVIAFILASIFKIFRIFWYINQDSSTCFPHPTLDWGQQGLVCFAPILPWPSFLMLSTYSISAILAAWFFLKYIRHTSILIPDIFFSSCLLY